jgi:xanthine dehydrogenase small subunit
MDAALNVLAMDGQDQFTAQEPNVIAQLQQWQHQSLEIHHPDQHYLRPSNLFEALAYRSQYPQARLVNGGSDVAIAQSKRFEHIPQILDLSNVVELKGFREEEGFYRVGAGLSFEDILVLLDGRCPSFAELMEVFASKQIRNLATLGGNIGSASPIGDTLPLLMAMGASVELISMSKKRIVDLETFVTGYRSTDLQADELIKWVLIPKKDPETKVAFIKASKRKDVDISTVSLGARLRLDENLQVSDIALVYGGMAQMVRHAVAAEDFLRHKPWTIENIEKAANLIEEAFQPISDARATKEARSIMAGKLLHKFFHQV